MEGGEAIQAIFAKSKDNARVNTQEHGHSHTACGTGENDPSFEDFELSTCDRIYIYILDFFGCLDLCARAGNKRIKTIMTRIDRA